MLNVEWLYYTRVAREGPTNYLEGFSTGFARQIAALGSARRGSSLRQRETDLAVYERMGESFHRPSKKYDITPLAYRLFTRPKPLDGCVSFHAVQR